MGQIRIISILSILLLSVFIVAADEKIASIEENSLRISAPEVTYCSGTTCTIEYIILNLGDADKKVSVSNYFYSDLVTPLKLERYGEITKTKSVNNPVVCACSEEIPTENISEIIPEENTAITVSEPNESMVLENTESSNITTSEPVCYCDNIETYEETIQGFSEVSSDKDSKELKSKKDDLLTLEKGKEEKFKTTIYQPLGQKTKYDVIAETEDSTKTILDPWIDTNSYYINLSGYLANKYNLSEPFIVLEGSNITLTPSNFNINDCNIFNFTDYTDGQTKWIVYDTLLSDSYEVKRAKIIKTLFYGTDGSDARLKPAYVTGISQIKTTYTSDISRKGYYISTDSVCPNSGSSTNYIATSSLTFSVSSNSNISGWSDIYTEYMGSTPGYNYGSFEIPSGTIINIAYGGSTSYEIGTNKVTDERYNEISIKVYSSCFGGKYVYGYGLVDVIVLTNATLAITDNTTSTTGTATATNSYIDFYTTYSIPSFAKWSGVIANQVITNNQNENLTILNMTDIIVTYDSSIVNQINDTALGNNLVSGTCYRTLVGQTYLNWTIDTNINISKDLSRIVNYTFTFCAPMNETEGKAAILAGIQASKIGTSYYSVNYNKKVYARRADNAQYKGTFDVYVAAGNKRYAFNYDQNSSDSFPTMVNITPVFYVWQNSNMTYGRIAGSVQSLIDSTN